MCVQCYMYRCEYTHKNSHVEYRSIIRVHRTIL